MSTKIKDYIAIVDDDALVRHSLTDCVESAGYSADCFSSAEEFLASGVAEIAECLIVDIDLPGLTGLDLQAKLIETDNHAPIVFVTAHGTDANRERAMRQGAVRFLAKPFRREELLKAIGAAISRAAL